MKYSVKRLRAMHTKAHEAYQRAEQLKRKAQEYQLLMKVHAKPPFSVGEVVESTGYLSERVKWIVTKIELNAGCSTGWQVAVKPADVCTLCGRSDHEARGGLSSGHFKKMTEVLD